MDQLKKDIASFHGGFENLIISLHKVFLDAKSQIRSEKILNSTLQSGKNGLIELDRLIDQCLINLSENPDLQEDLMQFLVSYKPRLENEINSIEDAIKNPTFYEETINDDDEVSQMLKEAEANILLTIQEEKEKLEQINMQQMKKQSQDEYLQSQRIFEQQQQMREAFKNFEKKQQEQQKNSWLQDGELQNFLEMKRKNPTPNGTLLDISTDDNWSFPEKNDDESNNEDNTIINDNIEPNNETQDISANEEEEEPKKNIESEQDIANKLLFQFLGIPTENQFDDNGKEDNLNEENHVEENRIKENENDETQTDNNINIDSNVSNENVDITVSSEQ